MQQQKYSFCSSKRLRSSELSGAEITLPSALWIRARSGVIENIAQSSDNNRRSAASYQILQPLNSINAYGSQLSEKQDDAICLFCENSNGFPVLDQAQKLLWKFWRSKHLQKQLKVDIISLIKTQTNKMLLNNTQDAHENLFRRDLHHIIMSSNKHELINKR